MKKIELVKECEPKLKALDWLLDPDNRNEGRTYLMAITYINIALKNPGQVISVIDHHPRQESAKLMLNTIHNIVKQTGLDKRFYVGSDRSFWIEPDIVHKFIDERFKLKTARTRKSSNTFFNVSNTPKEEKNG